MNRFYYNSHLGPSREVILFSLGRKRTANLSAWGLGGKGEDPIWGRSQAALAPALALVGTGGQRQSWAVAVLPP